jgi:hypothetical protein
MLTASSVNVAWHPASHKSPTEMREWAPKSGNRSTLVEEAGRPGIGREAVCVEEMVVLSGRQIVVGLFVGWMLIRLVALVVK